MELGSTIYSVYPIVADPATGFSSSCGLIDTKTMRPVRHREVIKPTNQSAIGCQLEVHTLDCLTFIGAAGVRVEERSETRFDRALDPPP